MSFDTFQLITVFRKITIFKISWIIFWIDSTYRRRRGCSVIQKSIFLIFFRFSCLVRGLKNIPEATVNKIISAIIIVTVSFTYID